jgi:hypothetical protein
MRVLRSMRLTLLALLIAVIPASSYAGVFISVGFAPPVLPVYVQPPCPEAGWMWTPGYWAYGDDGYYWVPGTWVPSPYVGALWTPGYWGWGSGLYVWHPGYWGPHVGYYGGMNYGFGYMGIGFAGGLWVGGAFRYNTAIMHVGPGIHNVYVDNTIVHNTTIVNNTHVAYSGGPGGINHPPTAQENAYSHESHQAASSFQTQHETAARANVSNYASHNGGHPTNLAVARPMDAGAGVHASGAAGSGRVGTNAGAQYHSNAGATRLGSAQPQSRPSQQSHGTSQSHPAPQSYGGKAPKAPKPEGHEKEH